MPRKPSAAVNFYKWNRKVLNAYWSISALTVISELIGLLLLDETMAARSYLVHNLLVPTALICASIGIAEWTTRGTFAWTNHLILAVGTFITTVLVQANSSIPGVQFVYLLPMLAAMLYFQKRKLLFSFLLNMATLTAVLFLVPELRNDMTPFSILSTATSMVGGLFIALGIMSRGIEIQQDLVTTIEQQQDLVVRSAMMEWLSKTDALTNLYNHKTFHEYLDKLVEQADQYELSLQLAILDIDNFKKINDTYGHWVGDVILKRVAQTIKVKVRPDDFVSRYGGEEFAVLMTEQTEDEAVALCEAVREAIAEVGHEELDGQSITISIGVQSYRTGQGKQSLFKGADDALYRAKRTGKNRTIRGFSPLPIIRQETS